MTVATLDLYVGAMLLTKKGQTPDQYRMHARLGRRLADVNMDLASAILTGAADFPVKLREQHYGPHLDELLGKAKAYLSAALWCEEMAEK